MNVENFNFVLMCNKICGSAHYKMKMIIVVLSPSDYKKWLKSKQKQTFKDLYFAAPAAVESQVIGADTLAVAAK